MPESEASCIRYLMREMDPSEEIEFERNMLNDQDLLIEVESLRRTYKKLGKLPEKDPPRELTGQILSMAKEQNKSGLHKTADTIIEYSRWIISTAAIVVFAFAGYLLFSIAQSSEIPVENSVSENQNGEISPWVDRNELIEFVGTSDQVNLSEDVQKEVNESYNKLRLVNSETGFTSSPNKIILTNTTR